MSNIDIIRHFVISNFVQINFRIIIIMILNIAKHLVIALMLFNSPLLKAQKAMNKEQSNIRVLVLFNTANGGTYKLAKAVAEGIEKLPGAAAVLKQVPHVKPKTDKETKPFNNIPYATADELKDYDGIAFGSPVHFGNMSTDMRNFLDQTIDLWTNHKLEGKPASVFMSAGSGAGREAAILSFWNTLAIHGMLLVPTGIIGTGEIDKTIPQGNTAFGTTSLAGAPGSERPSKGELHIAALQGYALAKAAKGYNLVQASLGKTNNISAVQETPKTDIEARLKELNITLPETPKPVGNYKLYKISGNQVFINQVALKNGKIEHPGKIGTQVTEEQAKEATKQTLLNILSILKEAAGGDLNNVKQAVQLTGFFCTDDNYTRHAVVMNEASNLLVEIFGESGMHTRATIGAISLPLASSVEIQAIFELK